MVGSIFSAFLFTSFWSLSLTFLGSWMVGYFVYERALNYMGLEPGQKMNDINIDTVFIGSCTMVG